MIPHSETAKTAKTPLGRWSRPADAPREFDTAHMVAMANVSRRQLQWWDEQGFIRPRHEKHRRYYSPAQAALVIVVHQLMKRGYTLGRCRKIRQPLIKAIEGAANVPARVWLVTDGRRVDWIDSLDLLAKFQREHPITFIYLTPSLRMVGL